MGTGKGLAEGVRDLVRCDLFEFAWPTDDETAVFFSPGKDTSSNLFLSMFINRDGISLFPLKNQNISFINQDVWSFFLLKIRWINAFAECV